MGSILGNPWDLPTKSAYREAYLVTYGREPDARLLEFFPEEPEGRTLWLEEEAPLKANVKLNGGIVKKRRLKGFELAIPKGRAREPFPYPPREIGGGKFVTPAWMGNVKFWNGFELDDLQIRLRDGNPLYITKAHKVWTLGSEEGRGIIKTHSASYTLPSNLDLAEGVVEYSTVADVDERESSLGREAPGKLKSRHSIEVRFGKTKRPGYTVRHTYYSLGEDERETVVRTEELDFNQGGYMKAYRTDGHAITDKDEVRLARLKYFQSKRFVPTEEILDKLSRDFRPDPRIERVNQLGHTALRYAGNSN